MSILQFAVDYNNFSKDIGGCMFKRIRDLREDRDFTQKHLASVLSCSQQVYSNYELGLRDIPTDILIKLSGFYGVSVDYILGISDDPTIKK